MAKQVLRCAQDDKQFMKVTEKDVAYVADLSNLELTEEERAHALRPPGTI